MNTLEVAHYSVTYNGDEDDEEFDLGLATEIAVPVIDGVPLHERLGDVAFGLALDLVAPPSHQWTGGATYVEDGRAVILDGTCGIAGCCGVFADITIGKEEVTWSDFFCRAGNVEIPDGLQFTFDRRAYERAIAGVLTVPAQSMTDEA